MFGKAARMVTILGGGFAVLVAGEVMLGEKSTALENSPELRAMERSPEFDSYLSAAASFCASGRSDCASFYAVQKVKADAPIRAEHL